MKAIAAKLSKGIPHVRVDFYEVNGKPIFGELTFCHFAGMVPFNPEEWDNIFGEWLKLPKINNMPFKEYYNADKRRNGGVCFSLSEILS